MGAVVVIILFALSSYLVHLYEQDIKLLINDGLLGMLGYVLITILAIVLAPISTLPLMPVASMLWGWKLAGILSIIGWVIGSQIAFTLARKYGKPLIEKFLSLERLKDFEKTLPEKNIFWVLVFLRMTVPVDILSYAVGLFSSVKASTYFFATTLGVTPFAFIFAYTGTLSSGKQLIVGIEIILLLLVIYLFKNKILSLLKTYS